MFKNKHLVLAMIIAPILAIISYFGVDLALSEKPQFAQEGESYKLAARSNCRYTSGLCSLVNGDFNLQLRSEQLSADKVVLSLTSDYPLDGVKIDLNEEATQDHPISMKQDNDKATRWQVALALPENSDTASIRLVAKANGILYYAQAPTTFLEYKTFFTDHQNTQQQ